MVERGKRKAIRRFKKKKEKNSRMWTHFSLRTPKTRRKETMTHRKGGWAACTGSFWATLSLWSEWKIESDASASTLVSHLLSEQQQRRQQQRQQRWNSLCSSLSAASPSITDTVRLFLMLLGDLETFTRAAWRFRQGLLFGQAVPLLRVPSGVWDVVTAAVFPPSARVVFTVNERDRAVKWSHTN